MLEESIDVVAQPLGGDGRVFDERERLVVVLHRHRQAEAGFANAPDAGLRGQVQRVEVAVAVSVRSEVAFERLQAGRQLLGAIGVELHAEERARIAGDECLRAGAAARRSASCGRG